MYQRDYILRMIEMIGQLIAAILGKIRKGEYETASQQISNLYYDVLKEDASFFRNLGEKDMTKNILKKHNYSNDHLEVLAELFNVEAELNLARGDKRATMEFSRKSLILFDFVDSETKTYSLERINKMESIKKRIDMLGYRQN
jgi:hypothetical protein